MTTTTSFGQWLKQRRKVLDLTREELAEHIGCAAVTLNKIEADERRPSKQMAELLAQHFNISPDERPAFIRFARSGTAEAVPSWGRSFHVSTNLPAQLTPLIGRDEDTAAILQRLSRAETRLLTLTGPPGIGKTRLALQVAARMLDDFTDGVFFIPLAPLSDAALVPTMIVNALGMVGAGPRSPIEQLKIHLRDKHMLLILDNFEQILTAAPQIAEILSDCPQLKILVTSRAPLRIRQERQIPVAPLALPDLARLPDVEAMTDYSAIMLFVEQAQMVKPDFALSPDNVATLAAICTRLDGLPLAIELISARVKLLPPAALLERLDGRLILQSDGLRDIEPRHRTLNAAIAWSYQLLNADEQALFRRLGVFVGGWVLEAAEAICAADLNLNVLDALALLLDKNLIKQDTSIHGEPRFMLLETLREYALEQLNICGEQEALRQRHADYFVRLAESAEPHVFGREQIPWFDRWEAELDNLRVVFAWLRESEMALRLAAALGWFFTERSHWNEGFGWLDRTIAANPDAPSSLRAKALHTAGALAWFVGNEQRSRVLCEQSLALARAANDRWNTAWALSHLAQFGLQGSARTQSAALQDESLTLFRELDDAMGMAHVLVRRAWIALDLKDYPPVPALLDEAEAHARLAGDKVIVAWITHNRGWLVWHRDGDLIQARTRIENSLALFQEAHFQMGVKNALNWLSDLELALGNIIEAQTRNQEVFTLLREIEAGDPYLPSSLVMLARAASVLGRFERAVRLLGAAYLIDGERGYVLSNAADDLVSLRDKLGEVVFAEAWAVGQAMTPAQIIAYTLSKGD